ncbi:hypothetical protein ACWC24_35445 [Streptomyces sp. NPDC001443]
MEHASPATEPRQLPAVELASAIRNHTLPSADIAQSCPDRIDAVDPRVNALADLRPEEALEQSGPPREANPWETL